MEMNQVEVGKIAEALEQRQDGGTAELSELQLALVGGGVGEVVLS